MAKWRLALIPLWLFGCTLTDRSVTDRSKLDRPAAGPSDASHHSGFADWQAVMHELDASCDDLRDWLLQQPQGDLDRTARRAQLAAQAVRQGYGRFEHVNVPNFARLAREAESWLLQISIEARQGHGELAAELFRTGRGQHCTRCHDAYERVHG